MSNATLYLCVCVHVCLYSLAQISELKATEHLQSTYHLKKKKAHGKTEWLLIFYSPR